MGTEIRDDVVAAFTDPGGVTLHAFSDRDGKWRARLTLSDGFQLYTPSHDTVYGLFSWFTGIALQVTLTRLLHPTKSTP